MLVDIVTRQLERRNVQLFADDVLRVQCALFRVLVAPVFLGAQIPGGVGNVVVISHLMMNIKCDTSYIILSKSFEF